jgi:hypothetical protein
VVEEHCLLGYKAEQSVESLPKFRKNISPPSNSSALKMDAICFSETLVDFQRTARRYIPEDSTLHNDKVIDKFRFLSVTNRLLNHKGEMQICEECI